MSKYKVGDKVKIKMDKENWGQDVIAAIKKLPNKVATIREIAERNSQYDYFMEEMCWGWCEKEIECLVSEYEVEITRFDLMDID